MPQRPDPAACRSIALGGRVVAYQLVRGRRKTIALAIGREGLRVGAPTRAAIYEIEALLQRHGDWVLQKLDAVASLPGPLPVADGLVIELLAQPCTIRLHAGRQRLHWAEDGRELWLPATTSSSALVLERALRQRARQVLVERLALYAARLDVPTPPLILSSARTRWGSCNSRGQIRLNWRLLFFPLPVLDYVVAHELAHLKEMNHSPRFWAVVAQLCPEWRLRRAEIKALAPHLPAFINP